MLKRFFHHRSLSLSNKIMKAVPFDIKPCPNRSWDTVIQKLKIPGFIKGDVFSQITLKKFDQIENSVDKILKNWKDITATFGSGFPGENEKERQYFLMHLMISIPFESLKMHMLDPLDPDELYEEQGLTAEMYIYADPSEMPVMFIVEARKHDIDQGRAQLYPQSKICYEYAKENENWDHPIYGVITTLNLWIFVRYDGENWLESPFFCISSE
jgi:hypothetical protein